MPSRRPHSKSRRGCILCKARKVKVGYYFLFTTSQGLINSMHSVWRSPTNLWQMYNSWWQLPLCRHLLQRSCTTASTHIIITLWCVGRRSPGNIFTNKSARISSSNHFIPSSVLPQRWYNRSTTAFYFLAQVASSNFICIGIHVFW